MKFTKLRNSFRVKRKTQLNQIKLNKFAHAEQFTELKSQIKLEKCFKESTLLCFIKIKRNVNLLNVIYTQIKKLFRIFGNFTSNFLFFEELAILKIDLFFFFSSQLMSKPKKNFIYLFLY